MRRARPNPALTERQVFALRDRIYTAVEDGLRELIEKKTLAKIFRPVPPETVGTVEQEMELLRLVTGDWKRTGKPYEACNFTMPQYLAFAYCAERALLAAGDIESASVFSFIRSAKDPKRVVAGYSSPGGLSRILQWYRDHGALGTNDSLRYDVHCDSRMLEFAEPKDCLRFSRSELFSSDSKWRDGWRGIDEKAKLVSSKFAWREADARFLIDEKMFLGGVPIGDVQIKNKNLDGFDMSAINAGRIVFEECSMNDCVIDGVVVSITISRTEFHRSKLIVNCEDDIRISLSNGNDVKIRNCVCDYFTIMESRMISLDIYGVETNRYGYTNFVDSLLTDLSMKECGFDHFNFTDCKMVDSDFSGNNSKSQDYGFMFDGCRLDRLKSTGNKSSVGYSFKTCKSTGLRSKIKGWKVVDGMIVKDESTG